MAGLDPGQKPRNPRWRSRSRLWPRPGRPEPPLSLQGPPSAGSSVRLTRFPQPLMTEQTTECPTATEFIPAEENGVRPDSPPGVRYHRLTGEGMELINEEPAQGPVHDHAFVCDVCGYERPTLLEMGQHLQFHREED